MIQKKISFHNMPHSDPLEQHASQKLEKINDFIKGADHLKPLHVELWLKANKQHPHHEVELHLKTPVFDLNAHDQGVDMYIAIDNTIDKMITMLKKEKTKRRDKTRKAETEKIKFSSDKYKL